MVALSIADRGVVNDGVETAERIDLGSNVLGASNCIDIAYYDRFRFWQFLSGVFCPLGITGMQNDAVALIDEQIGRHHAETRRRTGNEDA